MDRSDFRRNTTEEALEYLKSWGICDQVMHTAVSRMQHYMKQWAGGNCDVQMVTFSTVYGILEKQVIVTG